MAKEWICTICGYVAEGENPPAKCPQCGAPASKFKELDQTALLQFVTEHEIGVAKDVDDEMKKDLNAHFQGECTEVGMYLAMSRQADREGYPEVAEAFKRYAFEEAEHAAKFAELLGDVVWDTKTNLEKRMHAEAGANADKMRIAKNAKAQNLDARRILYCRVSTYVGEMTQRYSLSVCHLTAVLNVLPSATTR